MAILDIYNRKRGVTYVYESISYWDKVLKQPRSKRRLLGRRDPVTGELVPTRKRKAASDVAPGNANSAADYATLYKRSRQVICRKNELIQRLRKDLSEARLLLSSQEKGIARAVSVLHALVPEKEPSND